MNGGLASSAVAQTASNRALVDTTLATSCDRSGLLGQKGIGFYHS